MRRKSIQAMGDERSTIAAPRRRLRSGLFEADILIRALALTSTDQVGPYEILAPLGKGGMGEVYRARDTRLGREVALKMLTEAAAQDSDHLARFERETRAVAALNHPNILAIHDTGSHRGVPYAVTELLQGETLAERLHAGALAEKRAVEIACQIADGLAAAHVRGITHRDIKPENIFLTNDGRAKILDFGIARIERPPSSFGRPTGTATRGSSARFLIGTAGYMSPEQVRGKPIDARTDIFSLGAVFFEMLTGRQAFQREFAVETFGAVLKDDPAKFPEAEKISAEIRRFVFRCLEKDAADRYQSARDLLLDLRAYQAEGVQESAKRAQFRSEPPWKHRRTRVALRAAGAVFLFAIGLLAGRQWWPGGKSDASPETRAVTRFVLGPAPANVLLPPERPAIALSPDGHRLVYVGRGNGSSQLYAREMDRGEAKPLPGTEGAAGPFFSPDGEWVGFFSGDMLRKVSLKGGTPVTVASVTPATRGASWGEDGFIYFNLASGTAIYRVPASGGPPQPVTTLNPARGERSHRWPQILPGGKAILFTVETGRDFDEARIELETLDTRKRKILIRGGTDARYSPTGHIVYARGGALLAVPFDLQQLELRGDPLPILEGVRTEATGAAQLAFSRNGTLVYIRGRSLTTNDRNIFWVDRQGMARPLMETARPLLHPRLSPNAERLAFTFEGADRDIWVYELSRGMLTRLTFEASNDSNPVWTPDGKRITFASATTEQLHPNLFWKSADGSGDAERLWKSENAQFPSSWSPDGKELAFVEDNFAGTGRDIWILSRKDKPEARPFLRTVFGEGAPAFSPDGRWLAYASNESGRGEVYVQPYPGPGPKVQISTGGGHEPAWGKSGRELFYRSGEQMMAAEIRTTPAFQATAPRQLFRGNYGRHRLLASGARLYDVTPDGERFVMTRDVEEQFTATEMTVVLNWFLELSRRVPPAR